MMNRSGEVTTDIIQIKASGSLKSRHEFLIAGGNLGTLLLNAAKSEGTFQGAQESLLGFKKTSFWKSTYQLDVNGKAVAKAAPFKALSRALLIDHDQKQYKLIPKGGKNRSWQLLDKEQEPVCEYLLRGTFKRGALIRIISPIKLKLLVFGYCLVSERWQEESQAA